MISIRNHFLNISTINSPLVNCIKIMTNKIGISISWSDIKDLSLMRLDNLENYSKHLGMMLCLLNITSISDIRASFFPILVQENNTNNLYVILHSHKNKIFLYDALNDKYLYRDYADLIIKKAWQCCPTHFVPPLNFLELTKFVMRYFQKKHVDRVATRWNIWFVWVNGDYVVRICIFSFT